MILAGVLSLSFFIHNGCLSIMRNQRNPKNNSRDLGIAYVLVCLTYLAVGKFYCFVTFLTLKVFVFSCRFGETSQRSTVTFCLTSTRTMQCKCGAPHVVKYHWPYSTVHQVQMGAHCPNFSPVSDDHCVCRLSHCHVFLTGSQVSSVAIHH